MNILSIEEIHTIITLISPMRRLPQVNHPIPRLVFQRPRQGVIMRRHIERLLHICEP